MINPIENIQRLIGRKDKDSFQMVKIYATLGHNNYHSFISELLGLFEKLSKNSEGEYSLNYVALTGFSIAEVVAEIGALDINEIENLSIIGCDRTFSVAFNALKSAEKNLFETRVVFPLCENLQLVLVTLAAALSRFADIHYGYGRVLKANYDPASEKEIKKTISGTAVNVVPFQKSWLYWNPSANQMLKGVYPFNLVKKTWLESELFSPCVNKNGESIISIDSELVVLKCTSLVETM